MALHGTRRRNRGVTHLRGHSSYGTVRLDGASPQVRCRARRWPAGVGVSTPTRVEAPSSGANGARRWLLSVTDVAEDAVIGVADGVGVNRPRLLVAGGAWSSW